MRRRMKKMSIEEKLFRCDCKRGVCKSELYYSFGAFKGRQMITIGVDDDYGDNSEIMLSLENARKFADDLLALIAQVEEKYDKEE